MQKDIYISLKRKERLLFREKFCIYICTFSPFALQSVRKFKSVKINKKMNRTSVFDMEKFQILDFPVENVYLSEGNNLEFVINNRNKVRGNIKVTVCIWILKI
jgi:hypothetical protein